jgi:proteasome lid subunit RPN8/RPN11
MKPAKRLSPEFQFASWRVPQFARAVEYPLEVMEEIRAYACDELLQLSHGGDEVGGVLFGTRRDDLIRILTWRPIACDHTAGESFKLSNNDRMNLAVQLEVARQNPDLKDLRPLGWFVSHLRGDISLLPSDVETYHGFFPESSQVALVICPKGGGRASAGFFVREAQGRVQTDSSHQYFDLEPLHAATLAAARTPVIEPAGPIPEENAQPVPSPYAAPPAPVAETGALGETAYDDVAEPVDARLPAEAEPRISEHGPPYDPPPPVPSAAPFHPLGTWNNPVGTWKPLPPEREVRPPVFNPPSFHTDEKLPSHERWLWAIPIVLAFGIAALMLYQRHSPAPSTSIALRASSDAQTVQLAWDAGSHVVRDSDRADVEISDGGQISRVSLTGDQLHAGRMSYLPQSSDVGFTMTVYPSSGEPVHDATRLIGTAPNQPTQPPRLLPPPPAPTPAPAAAPPPSAEGDREVQQLREQLRKERARGDQLQTLVRILENRLGIQGETSRTQPH